MSHNAWKTDVAGSRQAQKRKLNYLSAVKHADSIQLQVKNLHVDLSPTKKNIIPSSSHCHNNAEWEESLELDCDLMEEILLKHTLE